MDDPFGPNALMTVEAMAKLQEFTTISLAMCRHGQGGLFDERMKSFPSEKFHRWCELGRELANYYGAEVCSDLLL